MGLDVACNPHQTRLHMLSHGGTDVMSSFNMQTNEITIKVSGKISIGQVSALGQEVRLALIGAIVKVEMFDSQDGT